MPHPMFFQTLRAISLLIWTRKTINQFLLKLWACFRKYGPLLSLPRWFFPWEHMSHLQSIFQKVAKIERTFLSDAPFWLSECLVSSILLPFYSKRKDLVIWMFSLSILVLFYSKEKYSAREFRFPKWKLILFWKLSSGRKHHFISIP